MISNIIAHYVLFLGNLQLRETLQAQATRDPLTGLYNRCYLQEALNREVSQAQRSSDSLGIVMLDVDTWHPTAGFAYNISESKELNVSVMYNYGVKKKDNNEEFDQDHISLMLGLRFWFYPVFNIFGHYLGCAGTA